MEKVVLSWSGGKDSAFSLYEMRRGGQFAISALLTTVTQDYDRISMHGVRSCLLEKQALSLGHPVDKIFITKKSSNNEYESRMKERLTHYKREGVCGVVFGDIFLESLRKYREDNLKRVGMQGVFPLWKRDTRQLALAFIEAGFRAVISCVDSRVLGKEFVGRRFDREFLAQLPEQVDPCGENGEFHSFVYAGPIFKERISYSKGAVVCREKHFYYCDLMVK